MAAVATLLRVMPEDETKVLHPFFNQPKVTPSSITTPQPPVTNVAEEERPAVERPLVDDAAAPKLAKGAKKSRRGKRIGGGDSTQQTLNALVKPSSEAALAPAIEQCPPVAVNPPPAEQDVDASRRKRRRTSHIEGVEVGADAATGDTAPPSGRTARSNGKRHSSPRVLIPASSPSARNTASEGKPAVEAETVLATQTPPKRVLRLNNKGTFGATPTRKESQAQDITYAAEEDVAQDGKRKKKPRRAKDKPQPKQMLVAVPYNENEPRREEVGETIDRIIAGTHRVKLATPSPKKPTPKKQRTPRKPKSTHPFFTGKLDEKPEPPKPESPRKFSATTPGKLRTQALRDRGLDERPDIQEPIWTSALLKDRLMVKHPGAQVPAWPDREQMHVRGLDHLAQGVTDHWGLEEPRRKGKRARLPFPQEDSILRHFASRLMPEEDPLLRDDGFSEPRSDLRKPRKLLLPGELIQDRVSRELTSTLDDTIDELIAAPSSQCAPTGALRKLYRALPNALTAFDDSKGETLSWSHKYAPATADEVLGSQREATVLRDWLKKLAVTAVEGAAVRTEKRPTAISEPKAKKRRRRKGGEMDDFLVDEDEEPRTMDELSEPEDSATGIASRTQLHRSVVQATDGTTKLSNAVLLSGPSGCGKTAATYAVAKELGYKIFEISSCDRRSGKDVLEKVGDMTENHLVKHHGIDAGDSSSAEDSKTNTAFEEQFQKDLESGRQGKMASFFKPKALAKVAPKKTEPKAAKVIEALKKEIKKPAKEQQQSLILLEEVDILFRDDKDFWATVFKLIASSKRPFIMTCNNEDLVPLQAMSLHAMLRFAPPAIDIATDYMLLLAASEGHLLKRQAVSSLYSSKQHDLRASITELDFWCQMGVGDPREGLSWIYQRWPPGSDVDDHGRKLRVVSEDTYHAGMGLFHEDSLSEEDRLQYAWREFGINPFDLPVWEDMAAKDCLSQSAESARPLSSAYSLDSFAALSSSLSAADVYISPGLPNSAPLDPTQPDLTDKIRASYIEGLALLQTDEPASLPSISASLSAATVLISHSVHGLDTPSTVADPLALLTHFTHAPPSKKPHTRALFNPLEPLAVPNEPSNIDAPLAILATDTASYVRSIARYDMQLESQRALLGKRARNTRAARSAVEGGVGGRGSVRRARWWDERLGLDLAGIAETGGREWGEVLRHVVEDCPDDSAHSGAEENASPETANVKGSEVEAAIL